MSAQTTKSIKIVRYSWAQGFPKRRADANAVGARIASLRSRHGDKFTAEEVVLDAKNPKSPQHSLFTWGDAGAAHQWRLHEARTLLQHLRIHWVGGGTKGEQESRMLVNFRSIDNPQPTPGLHAYHSVLEVLVNPGLRKKMVAMALEEATAWRGRYSQFHELSEVFEALERTAQRLVD